MSDTDGTDADADPRLVLLEQHDRLAHLAMLLADRVEHEHNQTEPRINPRQLRAAVADTLRDSTARRNAALLELGLEVATRPDLRLVE